MAISDRISVLHRGEILAEGRPEEIRSAPRGAGGVPRGRARRLMLVLDRVSGGYGEIFVLWDVSMEVRAGEAVALLGRNGMGKTTTLLAILGLNPARQGRSASATATSCGLPPFADRPPRHRPRPEGRQLFAPLTVVENLRIPFVNKQS